MARGQVNNESRTKAICTSLFLSSSFACYGYKRHQSNPNPAHTHPSTPLLALFSTSYTVVQIPKFHLSYLPYLHASTQQPKCATTRPSSGPAAPNSTPPAHANAIPRATSRNSTTVTATAAARSRPRFTSGACVLIVRRGGRARGG